VQAKYVYNGTSAGTKTLQGTINQDFITDIPIDAAGIYDLSFHTAATTANGTGTDTHTVTYIMIAQ
jgi:hypothetical protein